MPAFELQFPAERIGPLADTYATSRYGAQDDAALEAGAAARARGCYTRAEFLVVCDWKTPRTRSLVALNDERTVRTTSALALGDDGERERMVMLCTLRGVRTATRLGAAARRRPGPLAADRLARAGVARHDGARGVQRRPLAGLHARVPGAGGPPRRRRAHAGPGTVDVQQARRHHARLRGGLVEFRAGGAGRRDRRARSCACNAAARADRSYSSIALAESRSYRRGVLPPEQPHDPA
jgi:hypothetical protein